jgi:undecaprenyl-diphosphatase
MGFIEKIEQIDRQLLFAINGANSPLFDTIMWWVSKPAFGIPFYLLFVFLLYKSFGWKNTLLLALFAGAAVGLADLSAKYLFKEMFERFRPSQNLEIKGQLHYVNNYHGGMYGFVSSHAANMFSIAMLLGLWLKKKIKFSLYFLLIWAALIGYSRVYLGVHYPSDVVCGALLGMLIAFLMYKVIIKAKLINFSTK